MKEFLTLVAVVAGYIFALWAIIFIVIVGVFLPIGLFVHLIKDFIQ